MESLQEAGSELSDLMPIIVEVDTPKPEDMPVRAQQILCLRACGFSPASIARLCKLTPQGITSYIKTYDPEGKVTFSQRERRKFLAQLWEARAGEALLHITPDKLQESSAKELAGIASLASKSMKALDAPEERQARDPIEVLALLSA